MSKIVKFPKSYTPYKRHGVISIYLADVEGIDHKDWERIMEAATDMACENVPENLKIAHSEFGELESDPEA